MPTIPSPVTGELPGTGSCSFFPPLHTAHRSGAEGISAPGMCLYQSAADTSNFRLPDFGGATGKEVLPVLLSEALYYLRSVPEAAKQA